MVTTNKKQVFIIHVNFIIFSRVLSLFAYAINTDTNVTPYAGANVTPHGTRMIKAPGSNDIISFFPKV
jgi:hypothetical protein